MSLRATIPRLKAAPYHRKLDSFRYRTTAVEASHSNPPQTLSTIQTPQDHPYQILRSAGGMLPVYTDVRNDGSWKTVIRKIKVSLSNHPHFVCTQQWPCRQGDATVSPCPGILAAQEAYRRHQTLQTHLNEYFQALPPNPDRNRPRITRRPINNQLVIKGNWLREVREFIEKKGL